VSILQECNYQVKWIRLYDIYLENVLTKEIFMKYPFKNIPKIKKFLISAYNESSCPIKFKTFENSDEFNMNDIDSNNTYSSGNKKFFKYFFKLFEASNLKVVNSYERKETQEEMSARIEMEEKILLNEWKQKIEKEELINAQLNANKKNVKKTNVEIKPPVFDIFREPKSKREIAPCNINMVEKYSDFCKWVGSVFQSIKDLNVVDVYDVSKNFLVFSKNFFLYKNQ